MEIAIRNISKSFSKKRVIEDISLTVNSGELICLLGPSGSGKTTLIRLITGAIKPDSGEIFIDGVKMPDFEMMKQIGFMPQNDALYTDISGLDNLLFFGRLYKMPEKALRARITEVLTLVDLIEDKDKIVINYSGGMKKRLSLAIALLHSPHLLILDEPTVGIDPVLRKEIWNEFVLLKNQGITILVTTHVMDEAEKCQKAALIYNGRLIEFDSVENLTAKTETGSMEELFFIAEEIKK